MPRRNLRRAAAVTFTVACGLAVLPAAAPAGAEASEAGEHCIGGLNGEAQQCFDTFTEAVAVATDGQVTDAPASARAAATDAGFKAELRAGAETAAKSGAQGASRAQAMGDIIQGTFFEHEDYGGATFTVYGDGLCEKDGWVDYNFTFPDDWKNIITSVQPWAGCWLWLYPEPDLGGDRDGPFKENTSYIGSFMNDRTQSVGFS